MYYSSLFFPAQLVRFLPSATFCKSPCHRCLSFSPHRWVPLFSSHIRFSIPTFRLCTYYARRISLNFANNNSRPRLFRWTIVHARRNTHGRARPCTREEFEPKHLNNFSGDEIHPLHIVRLPLSKYNIQFNRRYHKYYTCTPQARRTTSPPNEYLTRSHGVKIWPPKVAIIRTVIIYTRVRWPPAVGGGTATRRYARRRSINELRMRSAGNREEDAGYVY